MGNRSGSSTMKMVLVVLIVQGRVHNTLEKFEHGVFTLKTHQMFSVHITPEKFENATITAHFGFVFEENLSKEIT